MNMMNSTGIPRPKHQPTDLHYEADCKAALDPMFRGMLDMTEAAGWDRRRAAYTLTILAAKHVTDEPPAPPLRHQMIDSAAPDSPARQNQDR